MTTNPDERNPEPDDASEKEGAGAEIGVGEPTTFEPEEDPEAAD